MKLHANIHTLVLGSACHSSYLTVALQIDEDSPARRVSTEEL